MNIALVSLCENLDAWPMGLLALASCIKARTHHQVRIVDANWEDPFLLKGNYDYIGISALTPRYPQACSLAQHYKISHPKAKLVIGGVHISTLPESRHPAFDYAVTGKGENALLSILGEPQSVTMENYPNLDYSLLNPNYWKPRHLNLWEERGVSGVLMTSLGCPYRCVFCSTSRFWGKFQYFPLDWVVRCIGLQRRMGVTRIEIWDDLFAANKQRLRALVEALEEHGYIGPHAWPTLKFRAQLKTTNLDEETCELLTRMNFKIANFGFESGNNRVLRYLKNQTAEVSDHRRAVLLCQKHKIRTIGSFIFGSPGETLKEKFDTVRFFWWAALHGADSLWYMPLTPYPGTPVWEDALRAGKVNNKMDFSRLEFFNEEYRKLIPWYIHAPLWAGRVFMKVRRVVRHAIGWAWFMVSGSTSFGPQ